MAGHTGVTAIGTCQVRWGQAVAQVEGQGRVSCVGGGVVGKG